MKTAQLLSALKIAQPALGAAENVLPVLAHFCFMGDAVYAYDDMTAIVVVLPNGLTCALHGDTLIGLLEASTGVEDVEIKMTEAGAQLNVGTGLVKVPTLSETDFVFTLPQEDATFALPLTDEAIRALEVCLMSVSDDALKPEFNGVTVAMQDGSLVFYSSDNATATRYTPERKVVTRVRNFAAVIPPASCSKLLKLRASLGRDESVKLVIGERSAIGEFAGTPPVTLFSKVLPAKPELFAKMLEAHEKTAKFFPVPVGLLQEVKKAAVLLSRESVKQLVLRFSKGKIALQALGSLGRMQTSVAAECADDAAVCVIPEFLLRILPHAQRMAVHNERSLVFSGSNLLHIVGNRTGWTLAEATATAPPPGSGAAAIEDDDIPF